MRPEAPALPEVREQAGQREDRHGQRHVVEHCQERHGKERRTGARGALQHAPEGEGKRPENQSCPFHSVLIHHRIAAVQPHEWLAAPPSARTSSRAAALWREASGCSSILPQVFSQHGVPSAMSYTLEQLAADCHQALAADPGPAGREAMRHHLERALADADRSEEHTSELQSLMRISYAVFRLKKKN